MRHTGLRKVVLRPVFHRWATPNRNSFARYLACVEFFERMNHSSCWSGEIVKAYRLTTAKQR